jgi:hypothetical protein
MIDAVKLRSSIAAATTSCVGELISQFGNSGLYGFALYTTDDLAGIVPAASYESGFQQRRQRLLADKSQCQWLKDGNIDVQRAINGDQRWSIYEWEHECFGKERFDVPNDVIRAAVDESSDAIENDNLCATVLACMVLALKDLDCGGFFSRLVERDSLTLFCSVPNSNSTAWLERESVKILNPPTHFATFARQRIAWIENESDKRFQERDRVLQEFRRQTGA